MHFNSQDSQQAALTQAYMPESSLHHLQGRLLELAHDAIIVRDSQSRIVFWNRGAEHLYGWTAQEVIGQCSHRLLQTQFPASREAVDQQLIDEGYWEGDLVHMGRDDKQVVVESRQVLDRDEKGIPVAILEINRDVTERRRLAQFEQKIRAEREARLDILQLILDEVPVSIYLVRGPELVLSWLTGSPRRSGERHGILDNPCRIFWTPIILSC
ncbi:PAS domain-containing protein [Dictyobacter kobayashii]|uniref:PAS domain-containing protein n=1 Tax=Dictyobacter kobayashii TaxID=2014872 RepID=A0A402ARR2_9CHLR|nr:PAS domain-containing protein [Dictyobacter kobayashii]GCE21788.1 hypothetical protein KDK_55880 [Dictyobacter kobayashii]